MDLQTADVLVWGTDDFPNEYRGARAVVYGHREDAVEDETGWPLPHIENNRTFGIDTISKGVLTAMRFPGGQIFQSGRTQA